MKAYLFAGAALAVLASTPVFAQESGAPLTRAMIEQRIQQQFTVHDTNHDGFIGRDELGPDADEALANLDTDHDGKLSLAEISAATLARFDAADTDHDGTLSDAEREAVMVRMQQQSPQADEAAPAPAPHH